MRGRPRRMEETEELSNDLVWGGRQHSHPDALIGMKPAAFCEWMFRQLGAEVTDTLDDIFPGSGAVARAWKLFAPGLPPQLSMFPEPSRGDEGAPSRLTEAQNRLAEQLQPSRVDERPVPAAVATYRPEEPEVVCIARCVPDALFDCIHCGRNVG